LQVAAAKGEIATCGLADLSSEALRKAPF